MRVLGACSLGGAGHLHPLVPFLAAARRRGDEVLVIGPPAIEEMVEAAGYPFRAGGEPLEDEVAPIRERLPVAPPSEASVLADRELFGRLATTAMLPGMERVCGEWLPDLVLREPCEYASAVVAHRLGIPSAQVAISLAEAESGAIATAAPALEEHRRGLVAELRRSPYLTRFPASLDPSPFPTTVRCREAVTSAPERLPDWWGGSVSPLVYLTFGTVLGYMSVASGVFETAMQAVAGLDVRVLMTVGRHFDLTSLGPVPDNVHVEGWVEQADVFGEAELVVCHGGSGTVFGALAAGIPVVAVPVFADQFENGRRLARCGAGVVVESQRDGAIGPRRVVAADDAPRITEGIEAVLASTDYRRGARRIAAEVAATPSVDDVLDTILTGGIDVGR